MEQKKIIIQRIISHLNPVPANAVQNLLNQSVGELELVLEKLLATQGLHDAEDAAQAHAQEAIRQSTADYAWAYCLARVKLNGKVLVEAEANKTMLENMLQPHEEPSPALYETILKQYSPQFSWSVPQPIKSAADREAKFR